MKSLDDDRPVYLSEPGSNRSPATIPVSEKEEMPMQCPIDNEILVISSRDGIEIDYCPKCRGVWLDRGELDKIIERASPPAPAPAPRSRERVDDRQGRSRHDHDDDERDERDERDDRRYRDDRGRGHGRKKRSSILSEIFDF